MAYEEEDGGAGLPDALRDPLGIPARRWPWMLLGLVLGLIGTGVAVQRAVPRYVATSSILVASQKIPEEFVRTTIREDPFSHLNAMVSEVLSRGKLGALIDEFDLYGETGSDLPRSELVALMRTHIEIKPQGQLSRGGSSQLFNVSYESDDPQTAAVVANRLAALFLEAGLKTRMERAIGISSFLRHEVDRAEQELREQTGLISDFKEKYRGELPSELDANLRRLEYLQDQQQALAAQISEAESRLVVLSTQAGDPASAEVRLAQLRSRLDEARGVYTEDHPNVLALRRQVEAVERELAKQGVPDPSDSTSRSALLGAERATVARLRAALERAQQEAADLDARVTRTPKRQEELSALEEKLTVLRESYLDFLRKANDAELAETMEAAQYGAQVSILDQAQPPTAPTSSRLKLLAIGIALSVGLGVGLGLAFEFLDPVLVAPDQVEGVAGVPLLGSVSRIS